MHRLLDTLVSGVHDTKNQLFIAESLLAACETKHGVDLGEVRYAIETAADRLSRSLAAYRLLKKGANIAIVPAIAADICAEVALSQRKHLDNAGISLEIDCTAIDEWPLDRDLVTDMLNNAVHNAGRFAHSKVRLTARPEEGGLLFCVEDDGPGFKVVPPTRGIGLEVAERLAQLHLRHGRSGRLRLSNDSQLGGARFELWLP
jgi:signal transduction histidine kinase